jgi:hypothetical protein
VSDVGNLIGLNGSACELLIIFLSLASAREYVVALTICPYIVILMTTLSICPAPTSPLFIQRITVVKINRSTTESKSTITVEKDSIIRVSRGELRLVRH